MSDTSPALEALVVALHEIGAVKVGIPLALFRDHPLSIEFPFSGRWCLSCSGMPVALRARVLAENAQDGLWGFSWVRHGKSPFVLPPMFAECRTHDVTACGVHRDLRSPWVLSRACPPRHTHVGGLYPAAIPTDLLPFLAGLLRHVPAYSVCQHHAELGSSRAVRSAHLRSARLLLALTPDAAARAAGSSESSS